MVVITSAVLEQLENYLNPKANILTQLKKIENNGVLFTRAISLSPLKFIILHSVTKPAHLWRKAKAIHDDSLVDYKIFWCFDKNYFTDGNTFITVQCWQCWSDCCCCWAYLQLTERGGGGMDTGVVAPSTADTSYVTEKRGAYVSVLVKLHYL